MKIDFATRCKKLFLFFPRRSSFWPGPQKEPKMPFSPAPSEKRTDVFRRRRIDGMRTPFSTCGRGAKGCLSRRHQRQRIPGVGRSAGGLSFKPNRGVEMAARPFRLPREYQRKRRFFAPFVRVQKGLVAWHRAKGSCRLTGRQTTIN